MENSNMITLKFLKERR